MIIKKYDKYFPHALSFIAAFLIFLLMQYLITTDIFNKKKDDDIASCVVATRLFLMLDA